MLDFCFKFQTWILTYSNTIRSDAGCAHSEGRLSRSGVGTATESTGECMWVLIESTGECMSVPLGGIAT